MPISTAISAWGTLLKVGDGATPENFTTVLQVQDLTPPAPELLMEDATTHSSVDGWEEDRPTNLKMGDCSFGVMYVPTESTHDAGTGLIADLVGKTLRNFQCVYPETTTWAFSAYVQKFTPKAPSKGLLRADVVLNVTGKPTLA